MNPYEVLGVTEGASDQEIRKAYLLMVKKYHPDQFHEKLFQQTAEKKLVEINEAYDRLCHRGNYSGGTKQGKKNAAPITNPQYYVIRDALRKNDLLRAWQLLEQIPDHDAQWYYLTGVVCLGRRQIHGALNRWERACHMDPGNAEYNEAYKQLRSMGKEMEQQKNASVWKRIRSFFRQLF